MTRVLGSLLLLAVGISLLLWAPRAGAKAEALEQRMRGLPARTNWAWLYRVIAVQVLVGAALVALGVLQFDR